MLGEVVGNYRIVAQVATGGMGVVYRAEHKLIGKIAAIKVLRETVSGKDNVVKRFFDEARVTTKIRHPGIVEIFDYGYVGKRAYFIMEFLDGDTLKQRIRARRIFRADEAVPVIRSVAGAVGAAHREGVIHRDLKPDNIFLVSDPDIPGGERTKVLDFGLAKLFDTGDGMLSTTRSGAVMGTPTYMAPEQCSGAGVIDHRADQYALGCILYEMMCGRPPFVAQGVGEVIGAHLHRPVDPPRQHNLAIHPELARILLRLLEKKPDSRYQSMDQLREALDRDFAENKNAATTTERAAERADRPPVPLPRPTGKGKTPVGGHSSVAGLTHSSTLGESAAQMVPMSRSGSPVLDDSNHRNERRGPRAIRSHPPARTTRPAKRSPIRWILGAVAGVLFGMGLALVAVRGLNNSERVVPPTTVVSSGSVADRASATDTDDPEESGSATERTPSQLGGPLSADKVLPPSTNADVRPPASATMDKSESGEPDPVEQSEGEGDEDEIIMEPDPVMADVEAAQSQYTLKLRIKPSGVDFKVRIDGKTRKGRAFVLDAGTHRITVSAPGYRPRTERVRLNRNRTVQIELDRDLTFNPGIDL
ncbi:MAG: protein kinase [Proteobacteria bacterium]|nr:protein kinase [Pseudomonadota bacterium]